MLLLLLTSAAGSGTQTLTPSLFTNTQTFYAPTVTPGAVTLTPSLFTNTNSFFAPTVSATYSLTPALYTNTQTFFAATVSPGVVTLTPALFTNSQTFFSPTVSQASSQTLTPSLFTNTNTFFGPTVSDGRHVAGRPKRKYYIELPDGRHLYGEYGELADVLVSLRENTPEVVPEIKREPAKPKAKKPPKIEAKKPEPVKIDLVDWLAEAEAAGKLAEIARLAMQDEDDELFLMMAA